MEIDKPRIEQIIKDHGFEDFKWIYPGGIIISQKDSRPNPESLATDVFKTVSKYDLPINVLKDYNEIMNRYSILLVE